MKTKILILSICLLSNLISCIENNTNETTNVTRKKKVITKTFYHYELNGVNFTTELRHPFTGGMFKYFNAR